MLLKLSKKPDQQGKQNVRLPYTVKNLLISEEIGLPMDLQVQVVF